MLYNMTKFGIENQFKKIIFGRTALEIKSSIGAEPVIMYEFKDQKIKEYLGDINYFLEQRNLENMREVEKRDVAKKETPTATSKVSYEDQKKGKSLQNRLSKVESQIKQLEIDIQADDKALEIKSSIGAKPIVMSGFIYHKNKYINKYFDKIFPKLEPTLIWQQRHPFK